jgi:hypothetical protein
MTILVPMPAERFAEFVDAAAASHAADNVASGRWSAQEAQALARAELERLLPDGHGTPDHYLYDINPIRKAHPWVSSGSPTELPSANVA